MQKMLRSIAIVLLVLGAVASTACTASPKVIDGMVYAEYPKADILGSVESSYHIAKVICTEDGKVRLLMVFDGTILGIDNAEVLKKQDVEISGVSCGKKLEELRHLAEIGRQYDKKPGQ